MKISVHMIFGVKLYAGFTCKARLVTYVHSVDTPPSMTYASVTRIEIVRIVVMIDFLNGLEIQCTAVHSSYLNTNPKERVYFYVGEEF